MSWNRFQDALMAFATHPQQVIPEILKLCVISGLQINTKL